MVSPHNIEGLWAFILVAIAAAFNAVMDRTETKIAFQSSIFSRLDLRFWLKSVSAHNIKFLPKTKYRPDAWHLAKSCMIVSLLAASVTYEPVSWWWLDFLLLGCVWNATFSVFYHRILTKKKSI